MIIGISGYARAGKDTIGRMIVEDYGFEQRAFADKLREAALALDPLIPLGGGNSRLSVVIENIGWSDAKDIEEVRRTLQRLGTEMGRETIDPDIWVLALANTTMHGKDYVITDVRFANEARFVQNSGFLIRVNRKGVGPANDHISETGLDNWHFDYIIENDDTLEDLRTKVHATVNLMGVR